MAVIRALRTVEYHQPGHDLIPEFPMTTVASCVTADELLAMPRGSVRYELIRNTPIRMCTVDDTLDGSDVLRGFQCDVRGIFQFPSA